MKISSIRRNFARDAFLICLGSMIFAIGIDCFEIPQGLAAGGVTGIATTLHAIAKNYGVSLPVGVQTLIMNLLLMIPVLRTGGMQYAARTLIGIVA